MKRITIDNETKQDLLTKFYDYLNSAKLTDSKINFSANITQPITNEEKPTIFIDAEAYLKMMLYVRDTSTEIAWHGTVERDTEQNTYFIKDVFLYPQKIAGATVQTDQEKYQNWLINIEDDDTVNNMRFQGHSHVNFGVTPSSTDLQYYNDMLQVLPPNDYYIFMILNKAGNTTFFIYDLAQNLIYENADINVQIVTQLSDSLIDDIEEDKEKYCEKNTYSHYNVNSYNSLGKNTNTEKDDDILDQYDYIMNKYKIHNEAPTETDKLYDDIDKRYKNATLETKPKETK